MIASGSERVLDRIAVSEANKSREVSRSSEAALTAALLELLTEAQAAVEHDDQAARMCLARATALVLANQDRNDALQVSAIADRGGFPRWQANRLVAYIEENLHRTMSTGEFLALTGISAGHFFRSFKATFGEPPFAYIAKRRIKRAQELMLTTSETLCQIALDCGLCDQSHLTRLFRRLAGTTPKAWRRENANRALDATSSRGNPGLSSG